MSKPLKTHLLKTHLGNNPEQTYLNERLKSARWLGWDLPAAVERPQSAPKARSVAAKFAQAIGLTPAPASAETT